MSPSESKLEFRATGGDCAGFLLTRMLLTVLTCGIYGFWLASDWKRWNASKTFVHGEPLVYKTGFADFVLNQVVKGALLLATCGIYLPWAIVKGNRYDWRHTTVADGRSCRFDGDGVGYIGTVVLGALIGLCTCGLGSPWAIAMGVRWNWSHTLIGGERVRFEGQVGDLVLKVIGGQILSMLTLGIYLPWHLVNLAKWRIENAVVARGTDTAPIPPDPLEEAIARYAADKRTWYALGGVAATLVLLVALGKGVELVHGWFADDSPTVTAPAREAAPVRLPSSQAAAESDPHLPGTGVQAPINQPQPSAEMYEVCNTYTDVDEPWLNLRSASSLKSGVVARLEDGTQLRVLSHSGSWMNVAVVQGTNSGKQGWVAYSKYIKRLESK